MGDKFTLNSNYNPNDPLSNRYIPVVANSTPSAILPAPAKTTPAPSISIVGQDPSAPANSVPINLPIGTPVPKNATNVVPDVRQPAVKPSFEPNPTPNQPAQKQFYRVGSALFDASTNKQINATDWKQNWTGRATEIQKGYEAIPNPGAISQYSGLLNPAGSKTMYGIKKATSEPIGGNSGGSSSNVNINGANVDITDPNVQEILKYAGQAGLKSDEVMSLLNQYSAPTADEKAKIEKGLGIPDVVNSLFNAPSKTTEQVYNEAYNTSELPSLKSKIADVDARIQAKKDQITQATSELQNNPWLSQASRGGRINNLNKTAQAELNNLMAEKQQYADLYNNGVSEIEKVITRYKDQLETDKTINASKLNYLLNQAEKQTTALAQDKQSKNLRYIPAYLKGVADKNLASTAFDLTKQQLELQKLGIDITNAQQKTVDQKVVKINGQDYVQNPDGTYSLPNVPAETSRASELKTNALTSAIELLKKFDAGDGTSAVGGSRIFGLQNIPGSAPKNFEIQYNNLKSLLSLDNVKYLKGQGQVSDTERKLLADASAKLDLAQSEPEFRNALADIVKGLSGDGDQRTTIQMGTESGYSQQEIQDAINTKGESAVRDWLRSKKKTSPVSGSGARTDRHNNPTAFTTDIAKQAGLREGVDYTVGDPFPNNPSMKTANILGDPIATTIKVIDKIGFQTQGGQQRWTYINMPKSQWNAMSYDQKKQTIAKMYQNEGGSALKQYFA